MVCLQIEPLCSDIARQIHRELKNLSAYSLALGRCSHRHFRYLKDTIPHGQQCAAAYCLISAKRKDDPAVLFQDRVLRIIEGLKVLRLQLEVAGDPLFIQAAEGIFIAGPELAQCNFVIDQHSLPG